MGTPGSHRQLLAVFPGADPWSIASAIGITVMDLGSVNAPPPLDHRDSGVGWSAQPEVVSGLNKN